MPEPLGAAALSVLGEVHVPGVNVAIGHFGGEDRHGDARSPLPSVSFGRL